MPVALSGLLTLERLSQGKPWAKLSWPFGPKTRLQLHPSFRQISKLQSKASRLTFCPETEDEDDFGGLDIAGAPEETG
jgi:hypothetical protein